MKALALSIIIPCHNEEGNLPALIADIRKVMDDRREKYEILVVDDASTDGTVETAKNAGAKVVSHPYNIGNGAAVKTGIRAAGGEIVLMMDGDGQHRPEVIPQILEELMS
ncbi:MAG: glycosyltransferase family 2 protein, partial [bacterium]|nr:glycosyltransferase family 2 protein [bacterium]